MNAALFQRELISKVASSSMHIGTTTDQAHPMLIDSQLELNHLVHKMTYYQPEEHHITAMTRTELHIQILQKRGPHLSITGLLKSIINNNDTSTSSSVVIRSLALQNVSVGELEADLLAKALNQKRNHLRSLKVGQLEVSGAATLFQALSGPSCRLVELSLRYRSAVNSQQTREDATLAQQLCQALQLNNSLLKVSLVGFPLLLHAQGDLAQTIYMNPQWTNLQLRSCNDWTTVIVDIQQLAQAIVRHPNMARLDLPHNDITDHQSLVTLLQSKTLTYLGLSQNRLGHLNENFDNDTLQNIFGAFKSNSTLQTLRLDMNPLTRVFCQTTLLRALQDANTSLEQVTLLPVAVQNHSLSQLISASTQEVARIQYYTELNAAGRRWWRQIDHDDNNGESILWEQLLSTSEDGNSIGITFGLLRESPTKLFFHCR